MDRRSFVKRAGWAGIATATGLSSAAGFAAAAEEAKAGAHADAPATTKTASPETLLLKDYRPKSIYKIPVTEIAKAKFPVIDMHSHPYAKTAAEIDDWVRNNVITVNHPLGTCAMGGGPDAVLDPDLKVRGAEGLRVVDAAALPDMPSAHINAIVMMLAERAADLIRGRQPLAPLNV